MRQLIRALFRWTTLRRLAPTLILGAIACLVLVALSLSLTGAFVFESAAAPGEPEHVSPYFGGVVGAMLTSALFAAWQMLEVPRTESNAGTHA
jgi:hypothetical protein